MRKKLSKNIEWSILICTVLLIIIGLFAIYSATLSSGQEEFRKQTIWLIVSIPLTIAVFFVDYSFMSKISPILYGVSIIMLILVLFTAPIGGASSWFFIIDGGFCCSSWTNYYATWLWNCYGFRCCIYIYAI